jgi:hypothetical protein
MSQVLIQKSRSDLRNLTGQKFGRLTVLEYLGRVQVGEQRVAKYKCICECKEILNVAAASLTKTRRPTRSCGCLQREKAREIASTRRDVPRKDLTGLEVGRLTVVEFAGVCPKSENLGTRRLLWWCICSCPKNSRIKVRGASLTCSAPTKSCGCLQLEYRHSCKQVPRRPKRKKKLSAPIKPPVQTEFSAWLLSEYQGIKRRCEDDNHPHYLKFGGSGIKLGWDDFEMFEEWVLEHLGTRPVGTKLVRIDRWGNYESGNLRWAQHQAN